VPRPCPPLPPAPRHPRRPLPGHCQHTCLLLCHPGPCPPCPLLVDASCFCGKARLKQRCGNNEFSCRCGAAACVACVACVEGVEGVACVEGVVCARAPTGRSAPVSARPHARSAHRCLWLAADLCAAGAWRAATAAPRSATPAPAHPAKWCAAQTDAGAPLAAGCAGAAVLLHAPCSMAGMLHPCFHASMHASIHASMLPCTARCAPTGAGTTSHTHLKTPPTCALQVGTHACACGAQSASLPCCKAEWHCDRPCGKQLACGRHNCDQVCRVVGCRRCCCHRCCRCWCFVRRWGAVSRPATGLVLMSAGAHPRDAPRARPTRRAACRCATQGCAGPAPSRASAAAPAASHTTPA
jgi:NF-X1-type zinc finger protein NFXL1